MTDFRAGKAASRGPVQSIRFRKRQEESQFVRRFVREKGAAVCVPAVECLPKVLTKALIKILIPTIPAILLHHRPFRPVCP